MCSSAASREAPPLLRGSGSLVVPPASSGLQAPLLWSHGLPWTAVLPLLIRTCPCTGAPAPDDSPGPLPSAETLFPNKVMFRGLGWTCLLGGHCSAQHSPQK